MSRLKCPALASLSAIILFPSARTSPDQSPIDPKQPALPTRGQNQNGRVVCAATSPHRTKTSSLRSVQLSTLHPRVTTPHPLELTSHQQPPASRWHLVRTRGHQTHTALTKQPQGVSWPNVYRTHGATGAATPWPRATTPGLRPLLSLSSPSRPEPLGALGPRGPHHDDRPHGEAPRVRLVSAPSVCSAWAGCRVFIRSGAVIFHQLVVC